MAKRRHRRGLYPVGLNRGEILRALFDAHPEENKAAIRSLKTQLEGETFEKLIEQGRIPRHESIVISITGNGYKTLEAVAKSVERPYTINATLQNFDELFHQLEPNAGVKALAS